jgi:hypothetical protein
MILQRSKYRGHKSEDLLIVSICRGIACYLKYLDIKGSNTVFYEALLRLPISEIVAARSWSYTCEYKLKEDPDHERGSYKKIDFVLTYYKQIIGIEMKFERNKNGETQTIDLSHDVAKLTGPFLIDSQINRFDKKYAFIIIVAEESVYKTLKYKGVIIDNEINDSDTISKKRKVFKDNESFKTSAKVGPKSIIVEAIKIGLPK